MYRMRRYVSGSANSTLSLLTQPPWMNTRIGWPTL
ncbi:hypothetical protein CHAD_08970 [Corynebacterium hadale]|nr:hypothetical protein CHAD_08970 [Corynebacterium hadale]